MLERIVAAMQRVQADCGDIVGAVVATPEGLVLAAVGPLGNDRAAAAAAYLADHVDENLAMMASPGCTEALIWTPVALWGFTRVATRHVVLAHAAAGCTPGTFRLALARLRRDLAPELLHLAPAPA